MTTKILPVCIYKSKCYYQKRYIIGKHYGKEQTTINICRFKDHCNQKRFMSPLEAKNYVKKQKSKSHFSGMIEEKAV